MTTATMIKDTASLFTMPSPLAKPVLAAFDGGAMTSDAGVALLSAAAGRLDFADRLASLIPDMRRPDVTV